MKKNSKGRRLFSQAFICAVLLCAFSVFSPLYTANAQQSESPATAFFINEISLLKERITTHEQNEAQALRALEAAKKALDLAIKKNDAAARDISIQAIALSEEVLSTVKRQKARDINRLKALQEASKWKDAGRGAGVAGVIKGEVLKKSKGGSARFDGKSPLLEGDTIETGRDGFAELMLPDYSYVSAGADTALEILKLDAEQLQSTYNIIKGKVYILRACLKHALEHRGACWFTHYRTHGAAVAVRGTEFSMEHGPEDASVTVFEGEVEVTEKDTNRVVSAGGMQQLIIGKDGSVQGPVPVRADLIHRWWED